MFKSLREKLSGWFGKGKEASSAEDGEREKNVAKKAKKKEKKKEEKQKKKEEKEIKKEEAKLIKEAGSKKVKKEEERIRKTRGEIDEELEKVETEIRKEMDRKAERLVKSGKKGKPGKTKEEIDKELAKVEKEIREGIEKRAEEIKVESAKVVEDDDAKMPAQLDKTVSPIGEDVEKVPARPPEAVQEAVKLEPESVVASEVEEEAPKKKGFFGKLAERLTKSELGGGEFNEFFDELEFTLLENNVALGVVDKIKAKLGEDLIGKQFGKKEVEGKILEALKNAIGSVLIESEGIEEKIKKKEGVFVILFFGINGSGKTTSVAKMAYRLKEGGISCVMAAGDTFRAASIEQLEAHGKKLGIEVVKSDYGKDPASVAFDAISHAKKTKKKVVLIDTAGRMYTKQNLMKEMEKIVKVSKPDLKIFVGESITGNDATEQAKMFNETAGIDGIILTKADVDEKAGAILSVSHVTGKPILFLGTGQNYEDLKEFKKEDVLKGLGLGE